MEILNRITGSDLRTTEGRIKLTGILIAIGLSFGGFYHGFYEILQGNVETGSIFIDSIGPDHVRWSMGTDPAVSLMPSFLLSGIASVITSFLIVLWALFGVKRRSWPYVMLGLFILLTFVGGGVGHIPFFLLSFYLFTRKTPAGADPDRKLALYINRRIQGRWLAITLLSVFLFITGLQISVTGYVPFSNNESIILLFCWGSLFLSLFLIYFSYNAAVKPVRSSLEYKDNCLTKN